MSVHTPIHVLRRQNLHAPQAPVSLAGALEEYLNDPNFEQNRIEYKTNKEIADRNAKNGVKSIPKPAEKGQHDMQTFRPD